MLNNKGIVFGTDINERILGYSILFDLPLEIWLIILSKDLDEKDLNNFFNSIPIQKFNELIAVSYTHLTLPTN